MTFIFLVISPGPLGKTVNVSQNQSINFNESIQKYIKKYLLNTLCTLNLNSKNLKHLS